MSTANFQTMEDYLPLICGGLRSFDEMAKEVLYLATHKKERESMGRAAYETITKLWNAEHAAAELLRFAEEILRGEPTPAREGPLSKAPVIAPKKMYRLMTEKQSESLRG